MNIKPDNLFYSFFIFFLLTLASCEEQKNESDTTKQTTQQKDSLTLKEFIRKKAYQEKKPISADSQKKYSKQDLYGNWVYEGYIDKLNETQSPYQSRNAFNNISELVFADKQNDSVLIIYGNHEGAYKKYNITPEGKINIGNNEFMLKLRAFQNTKTLTLMNKKGGNETFTYMPTTSENRHHAIHYLVKSLLFAGTYEIVNDPKAQAGQKTVTFKKNGLIKGMKNYNFYEVLTDYDDIANFDIMQLKQAEDKKGTWYGWKKENNILTIYNLKKGDDYQYKKGNTFLKLKVIQNNS